MESDLLTPIAGGARRVPDALIRLIERFYRPAGLHVSRSPEAQYESAEYSAARFGLNGHGILFREAKTTPTKLGQFVTVWKRPEVGGIIAPLDVADDVAFVAVNVADATHQGQFVFDHKTLAAKGVMSVNGKGGKRAIRVYPPWVTPIAKDAVKTQKWQLNHFIDLDDATDLQTLRKLFEA